MRAEYSVNLLKRVFEPGFARAARHLACCTKNVQWRKTLQIEGVDDRAADGRAGAARRTGYHLANLRLAHAEILFTQKIAWNSLVG
jgi:hypothetical protein